MAQTREFNLYLNAGKSIPLVINVNQYDRGEQWVFTLYSESGVQYTPSSGAIVGIKSDNLGIINTATVDSSGRVVVTETQQMTAAVGKAVFELLIDDQTHGTANFIVMVEEKPGNNADLSESDLSLIQQAIDGTSATAIAESVSDWMDENLTPTTPVVDSSLTVSGAAADAKVTGDEISELKSQIEQGTDSGLTAEIKQALLQFASKVAYIDENGQDYYDDLYDALYPPVVYTAIRLNQNSLSFGSLNSTQQLTATTTPSGGAVTWASSNTSVATVSQTGVVTSVAYGNATITASCGGLSATCSVTISQATVTSISASYTQSGTVYNTDSLDDLKSDLVVTATWSNSSTSTVASGDYTLSGTLEEGTSTITVSYAGKTATFNVSVTDACLTTSAYITIANETLTNGYINDNGETATLANNYFIDKLYDALPFALGANDALASSTLRSAYYDASQDFIGRDYSANSTIKTISESSATYEKVGWQSVSPTYVFLLKDFDETLFVNSNSSINSSGGLDTENNQVATDLISLESGCDKFVLIGTGTNIKIAFYDSNENFISRFYNVNTSQSSSTPYGDIPSNAAYYRVSKISTGSYYHPLMRGI